jgi:predicted metal-dependent phosphoesterase TrpH
VTAIDPGTSGHRYFLDLHCHTRASFDSLSSPASVVRSAAARGLTHIAITDHDRVDGAFEARDAAPPGLSVIVGQELRTTGGDLIAAFIERPIPAGLSAEEAISAVREQGGLVGLPHPFDRFRGSMLRNATFRAIADRVDWIEAHNARAVGSGNEKAASFARERGLPGVAVSDAHTTVEIGVAYVAIDEDPSTPEGLLEALGSAELVTGRASYVVRAFMPVAKTIQRLRGNRRAPMVGSSPHHPVAR